LNVSPNFSRPTSACKEFALRKKRLDGLARARLVLRHHRVSVHVGVLHDQVAARRDDRGVRVELREHVLGRMVGVEHDEHPGDTLDEPAKRFDNRRIRRRAVLAVMRSCVGRSASAMSTVTTLSRPIRSHIQGHFLYGHASQVVSVHTAESY
jgi:hypothetical protein